MSSTESSGAPAEASATTPAPAAAFPAFGSTRGSGLARGKRPTVSPAATTAAATGYTPTAIEVINAPREYQNPFAPANTEPVVSAETPAAASPEPVAPIPAENVAPAAVATPSAVDTPAAPIGESTESSAKAELNILEPEQPKVVQAQTWESEGFRPSRESRGGDRPRREERAPRQEHAAEPVDIASIPEKFLYVRPGHTYVPTPSNYGGAPRERHRNAGGEAPAVRAAETAAEAPAKSGGFIGWLKSLFGGPSSAPAVASGTPRDEQRREGGQRRHRGGRNRGGHGGGEGGQRRGRGGRGRGGYRSGASGGDSTSAI